jgi:hypothetical protein
LARGRGGQKIRGSAFRIGFERVVVHQQRKEEKEHGLFLPNSAPVGGINRSELGTTGAGEPLVEGRPAIAGAKAGTVFWGGFHGEGGKGKRNGK